MTDSVPRGSRGLRHDTMAWRVAAILTLSLFALFALGAAVYVHYHAGLAPDLFKMLVADRVDEVVDKLEEDSVGRRDRQDLARAYDRWNFRIELSKNKPDLIGAERGIREFVETGLKRAVWNRPLSVAAAWSGDAAWRGRWHGGVYDILLGRRKAIVAVGLRGNRGWVVFTLSTAVALPLSARQLAAWAVIVGLLIVPFSIWVSRRATEPVRRFSDVAADLLSRDALHAPALPETGPTELQRATRAFNRALRTLQMTANDRRSTLNHVVHEQRHIFRSLRRLIEDNPNGIPRAAIEGQVKEMETLQQAMLGDLSRDAAEEAYEEVDLALLVRSLCENVDGKAAYRGPEHVFLYCALRRIRSAFGNLIDNAIAYGDAADVELTEDDTTVRLVVRDRGPGIEEDQRENVFVPRYLGGGGLGLAIARQAVRRHGGDIELLNRAGGGLEAVATLPKSEQKAKQDAV